MKPLKVGRTYIDTDKIVSIVTPSNQAGHKNAAVIRYVTGAEETFFGDDADIIRAWLAPQAEPPKPATLPITTKVDAKVNRK